MQRTNGVKILKTLGYNYSDMSAIINLKFSFETHLDADHRLEIGYEYAARLYKIFGNRGGLARTLYDFIDGRRRNLEKNVFCGEIVEELEENLGYWKDLLLQQGLDLNNY